VFIVKAHRILPHIRDCARLARQFVAAIRVAITIDFDLAAIMSSYYGQEETRGRMISKVG
jgi:hypothetical protein